MTAKLLAFLFLGVLVALAYHLIAALVYRHFFPTSLLYQTYWYVPLVVVPALLLGGLARLVGLLRADETAIANAAALAILAGIVVLTVGAPYSCLLGCF